MRKEVGWKWYHSIGPALICSRGNFQTNWCRPHPLRGTCFCHLKSIIVSNSVGLRHTYHIKILIQTMVLFILPGIWDTVRIGSPLLIFSNNAIIPTDIWSVGKEPLAMFELTTWHDASFLEFCISHQCHTIIGKQLLFSNDRNRFRCSTFTPLTGWGMHKFFLNISARGVRQNKWT